MELERAGVRTDDDSILNTLPFPIRQLFPRSLHEHLWLAPHINYRLHSSPYTRLLRNQTRSHTALQGTLSDIKQTSRVDGYGCRLSWTWRWTRAREMRRSSGHEEGENSFSCLFYPWRWRWLRRIVASGRRESGKPVVAWFENGSFGQSVPSSSFPQATITSSNPYQQCQNLSLVAPHLLANLQQKIGTEKVRRTS